VFKPTDLVICQERREVGFGAVLADGGGNFARRSCSFLAQFLGFI
jgi:hypothetical protein